jgi:hypothetical protein
MEARRELREAWEWTEISDAEFADRAEQIGMGRQARQLISKDLGPCLTVGGLTPRRPRLARESGYFPRNLPLLISLTRSTSARSGAGTCLRPG